MDYKHRRYFLVDFGYADRRWLIDHVPTLELHTPYNHLSRYKKSYDGTHVHTTGLRHVDAMVSCDIKYTDELLYQLYYMHKNHSDSVRYFELTKDVCGQ